MIVFAMISAMPSACATVSADDFCAIYRPVYSSLDDTEETLKQLDRNNAVWLELCE